MMADVRFMKNNCLLSCICREKFVPLHQDAERTKASENCGMAMEKIFLSAQGNSAWRSGKNKD